MRKVIVYTDGSTLGNGQSNSACGWACKLIYGPWYRMKSGGDFGKTNNVMEMTAVLKALQSIHNKNAYVELYSDSKYVVETIHGNFKIGKNQELWEVLLNECRKFPNLHVYWVKGHDKNQHNNDVDRRAVEESVKIKR